MTSKRIVLRMKTSITSVSQWIFRTKDLLRHHIGFLSRTLSLVTPGETRAVRGHSGQLPKSERGSRARPQSYRYVVPTVGLRLRCFSPTRALHETAVRTPFASLAVPPPRPTASQSVAARETPAFGPMKDRRSVHVGPFDPAER